MVYYFDICVGADTLLVVRISTYVPVPPYRVELVDQPQRSLPEPETYLFRQIIHMRSEGQATQQFHTSHFTMNQITANTLLSTRIEDRSPGQISKPP